MASPPPFPVFVLPLSQLAAGCSFIFNKQTAGGINRLISLSNIFFVKYCWANYSLKSKWNTVVEAVVCLSAFNLSMVPVNLSLWALMHSSMHQQLQLQLKAKTGLCFCCVIYISFTYCKIMRANVIGQLINCATSE